jgi:hypothetical protein
MSEVRLKLRIDCGVKFKIQFFLLNRLKSFCVIYLYSFSLIIEYNITNT